MPHYISLLRGINVSGKNKIKMAELSHLYVSLGFSEVKTYIQSGNITFKSPINNKTHLSNMIKDELYRYFEIKSIVIIKKNNVQKDKIKFLYL